MPKRKAAAAVFRLHVELEDVSPPVWRKVLVPSNITLRDLHITINELMGWTNSHLHRFVLRDRTFGDFKVAKITGDVDLHLEDEKKFRLDELLRVGQLITYEYDFGDGWRHRVEVEKRLEPDDRVAYPLCTGGARACPPEDVGGPGGYEHLLAVLQDEKAEEHDDLVAWVDGFFDPEGFDVNRTNQALQEKVG